MSPSSLAAILEICKYNISLHIWNNYNIHMLYFNKYAYNKVHIWARIYITDDGSIFHGTGQYSIIEKWPAGQFSMGVNILSDTGLNVLSSLCAQNGQMLDKPNWQGYTYGLAQDCGNSSANALELPQPCTKPSTCTWMLSSQSVPVDNVFIPVFCVMLQAYLRASH